MEQAPKVLRERLNGGPSSGADTVRAMSMAL